MSTSTTFYKKQNIGTLLIPPRQVSLHCHQIETDNGLETLLSITKTEATLGFCIIQYDAKGNERMRSREWNIEIHQQGIEMSMMKRHTDSWSFFGINNIELELSVADNGGDISLWIYDLSQGDARSSTPEFSQVMSGGQSPVFRQQLLELKKQLIHDNARIESTQKGSYYILLERLYDAIGQERKFQSMHN